MNERTNEHKIGRTDKQKEENYIPLGINAGGINNSAWVDSNQASNLFLNGIQILHRHGDPGRTRKIQPKFIKI